MDATLLTTDGEFPSHHVLKRFFSRCGFRVEIARGRGEWLSKAHTLEPEVLVIDLDASTVIRSRSAISTARSIRYSCRASFRCSSSFNSFNQSMVTCSVFWNAEISVQFMKSSGGTFCFVRGRHVDGNTSGPARAGR